MKTCTKCGETKPKSEFSKSTRDGLQSSCKACAKATSAAYYAANREKLRAYNTHRYAANIDSARAYAVAWRAANIEKAKATEAASRKANREKRKAYDAEYRAANHDKQIARCAAWRAANRDKVKAYNAAWDAANPEIRRATNQNRRARKREAGGRLSSCIAVRLFKLQKGKCACCGKPLGDDYHLDHIMPLALGGTNTDDNMQLLRAECNQQKHAKHPVDFMQQRGFLL